LQVVLKSEAAEVKHFEEAPTAGENPGQVEEALNRAKSDLEVSKTLEQQRQATESEAEQQLRAEQDKLSRLEHQLDELVKKIDNATPIPSP
jgi:hypothetical protein